MVRTQIQLTERQAEALKEAAARQGVSMAELIRQAVDRLVASSGPSTKAELRSRAAAVAGKFRSGRDDVSVRHDDYYSQTVKP